MIWKQLRRSFQPLAIPLSVQKCSVRYPCDVQRVQLIFYNNHKSSAHGCKSYPYHQNSALFTIKVAQSSARGVGLGHVVWIHSFPRPGKKSMLFARTLTSLDALSLIRAMYGYTESYS